MPVRVVQSCNKIDFAKDILYYLKKDYKVLGFSVVYRKEMGANRELYSALVVNMSYAKE